MRLVLLLVVIAACDRGNSSSSSSSSSPPPLSTTTAPGVAPRLAPTPAQTPSTTTPSTPTSPSKAHPADALAVADLVSGLPPFGGGSRTSAWDDYAERSVILPTANEPTSLISHLYAVAALPGDARARFMLGCALAQQDFHAEAHQVIEALAAVPNCKACTDALANAGPLCQFDARTLAAATVTPSAIRTAAIRILASLNDGDPTPITPYLRGTIELRDDCSVCDEGHPTHVTRLSPQAFITHVRGADERLARDANTYNSPSLLFCDERCCSGPIGFLTHSATTVTSICFRGSPTAPVLSTIHSLSG